jgi:hypothetical protein
LVSGQEKPETDRRKIEWVLPNIGQKTAGIQTEEESVYENKILHTLMVKIRELMSITTKNGNL